MVIDWSGTQTFVNPTFGGISDISTASGGEVVQVSTGSIGTLSMTCALGRILIPLVFGFLL